MYLVDGGGDGMCRRQSELGPAGSGLMGFDMTISGLEHALCNSTG